MEGWIVAYYGPSISIGSSSNHVDSIEAPCLKNLASPHGITGMIILLTLCTRTDSVQGEASVKRPQEKLIGMHGDENL